MIITNEQFNDAYSKLPYTLREFLAGDELGELTLQIGNAHGLHIDTVGEIEQEVTNMLLGLSNPAQFLEELKTMGIPQESTAAIVEELNAKIFMPLREKMRNQPVVETKAPEEETLPPIAPQPQAAPTPVVQPPAPAIQTVPPAPVRTYSAPPIAVTPATPMPTVTIPSRPSVSEFSIPVSPSVPAPKPISPTPIPVPTSSPTTPPISISSTSPQLRPAPYASVMENVHVPARTMQQDMEEAKTGHPATPLPTPIQAPALSTIPSMPAASPMPSVPIVSSTPVSAAQPQVLPKPSENRDALHAVLKEYGVDPYREPPL